MKRGLYVVLIRDENERGAPQYRRHARSLGARFCWNDPAPSTALTVSMLSGVELSPTVHLSIRPCVLISIKCAVDGESNGCLARLPLPPRSSGRRTPSGYIRRNRRLLVAAAHGSRKDNRAIDRPRLDAVGMFGAVYQDVKTESEGS